MNNIFSIKIGGAAGQGIKSAGLMLAKQATRSGFNTYDYTEYPSLIRGGHNVMQIVIGEEEVLAPTQKLDLLIALNQETINLHLTELTNGSGIVFDNEGGVDTSKIGSGVNLFGVPLKKIAQDCSGGEVVMNTVALGSALALLSGNLEIFNKLLQETFASKPEVVELNQKAAKLGYDFALQNFSDKVKPILKPRPATSEKIILNGDDAVALGAIEGGMQFASIYPMSPISNILHILAENQEKYGFVYKQPEDEIAAINMAVGASIAGARSLTATSGGGFCLMVEGLGLAGMVETPLVVVIGSRPGPATGLPTWSEQGDLQFALNAAHGDFPKIVLAPGDAKETFELTAKALNLADKYQTPIILLIDKNICENDQSFEIFSSEGKIERGKLADGVLPTYERYILSEDGISPRGFAGSGNFFIANSDEHDSLGYSTEKIEERNEQMKKRMEKLLTCEKEDMEDPQLFGSAEADLTLVSWGSNKGAILQTLKNYPNVNFVHLTMLSPFPTEAVKNILKSSKYIIDVEENYTGQLARLIKEKTGIEVCEKLLKYDGRPFFIEEIEEKIKNTLKVS
ncbi:MAG: 2-oxoacid:acceptor oxidoreductase subunit alpha [Candidatus Daviesbacteria bacterium]